MRELGTFGSAGRSGRVDQRGQSAGRGEIGDIALRCGGRQEIRQCARNRAMGRPVVNSRRAPYPDALDHGHLGATLPERAPPLPCIREQQPSAALTNDRCGIGDAIVGKERHDHQSEPHRRDVECDPVDRVGHQHGHPIPGDQPFLGERHLELGHANCSLSPGQRAPLVQRLVEFPIGGRIRRLGDAEPGRDRAGCPLCQHR